MTGASDVVGNGMVGIGGGFGENIADGLACFVLMPSSETAGAVVVFFEISTISVISVIFLDATISGGTETTKSFLMLFKIKRTAAENSNRVIARKVLRSIYYSKYYSVNEKTEHYKNYDDFN